MPAISGIERKQEITYIAPTQEEMELQEQVTELQRELFEFQQRGKEQDRIISQNAIKILKYKWLDKKEEIVYSTFIAHPIRPGFAGYRDGWRIYLGWMEAKMPQRLETALELKRTIENRNTFFCKLIIEILFLLETILEKIRPTDIERRNAYEIRTIERVEKIVKKAWCKNPEIKNLITQAKGEIR